MTRFRTILVAVFLAALATFVGVGSASASTYPNPPSTMQRGTAVVDGDPFEWAFTRDEATAPTYRDFFAFMYRAGRADLDKPVESMMYMRYNCTRKTAYILVMAKTGVKILVNGDQFVKFGQNDVRVSAGSSNFRFVGQTGSYADGWEASFAFDRDSISDLNVHAQVFDGGSQTSAVDQRSILLKRPACTGADPDVEIAVSPSPEKSGAYGWDLTKTASPTSVTGSTPITYTVTATRTGPTNVRYRVSGSFTATSSTTLTGAAVEALTTGPGGGACTVSGSTTGLTLTGGSPRTFNFSCDETTLAPTGVAARVLVPSTGTWTGSQSIDWSSAPAVYLHREIYITDSEAEGSSLPTTGSPYSGTGQSWTYNKTWAVPGSGCTSYPNTATLYSKNNGLTPVSRTATVQVCSPNPSGITVAGTATPSFTRTFSWTLTKVIDGEYPCTATDPSLAPGTISCRVDWTSAATSTTVPYTVTATKTTGSDSAFRVEGTFTLTGTGASPPSANVGAITAGSLSSCTVTSGGSSVTLPTTVSTYPKTFAYSCSGSATATTASNVLIPVTPSGGSTTTYQVPFDFSTATPTRVNDTATVTDTFNGGSPVTLGTTSTSDTWRYSKTMAVPGAVPDCTNYPNTARLTATSGDPSPVSRIVRICRTGGGDPTPEVIMDVLVDGNFTRVWTWDANKRLTGVEMLDRDSEADPPRARFTYRVGVSQRPGGASGIRISGSVGVRNNLLTALSGRLSVTIPQVSDEICGFESTNAITGLPVGSTTPSRLLFTCYLDSLPSGPITPRVTLSQDGTPASWTQGGTIDFASPTQVTVVENRPSVTLYDNFNGQGDTTKPDWANVSTDRTFTYTNDLVLDTSECVAVVNTVRLFGVTPRPTSSWTADYCPDLGTPLPITGVMGYNTRATSEWSWSVAKRITSTEIDDNDVRISYSVTATRSAVPALSDYGFSGNLLLTNPNPWTVSGVSVAFRYTPVDLSDSPDCRFSGSSSLTRTGVSFAPNQTVAIPFTCTTSGASGGQVSATISGGGVPPSVFGGTPGRVVFTSALGGTERNARVQVLDAFNGGEEVILGEDVDSTRTFTYTKLLPLTTGCTTYSNVARLAGDAGFARSARSSAQVCWQSSGDVVIIRSEIVEKIGRVVTTVSSETNNSSSTSNNSSSDRSRLSIDGSGQAINATRLTVSKSGPGTARRGQLVNYRLTITNNTSKDAAPVTITDALPKGMTFVPGRLPDGGSLVNRRVATIVVPTLEAGESVTLSYPARANATGRLCNNAIVRAAGFANSRGTACVRISGAVRPPIVTG